MAKHWTLNPDMPIDELMRKWPAAIRVLIEWRMHCIGCPIGIFHTVSDACSAHEIDEREFFMALDKAINSSG